MKRYAILLLVFSGIISCTSNNMTLEELKKASWINLEKGIDYIDLTKGKTKAGDSIRIRVKGHWGSNITIREDAYNKVRPDLAAELTPIINNKLPESTHGYLKINLYQMANSDTSIARVYLRNNIDSSELSKGIQMINAIKGVIVVEYISKEMAKERYLADGNEDWTHVLDENPLPASIEVKFDEKIIPPENYQAIQNKIKDEMLWISEISFHGNAFKKYQNSYFILEYSR